VRSHIATSRRFFNKVLGLSALLFATVAPQAHASDYGCKVLLCLANPNGPKAVSECVPPIEKLFDDLKKGRSFPSCDMSGNSYAEQGMSYYDPCPDGTTALGQGQFAIQGTQAPKYNYWWGGGNQQAVYEGIGTGDGLNPGWNGDSYSSLTTKICVGNKVGDTYVSTGSGDNYWTVQAGVYDQVALLDPQGSPRIIDVFIDDGLYRRVRW